MFFRSLSVVWPGGRTALHRVDGLGRGIDCGVLQALLHIVPAVVVVNHGLVKMSICT